MDEKEKEFNLTNDVTFFVDFDDVDYAFKDKKLVFNPKIFDLAPIKFNLKK
jgi:hypothetical protein